MAEPEARRGPLLAALRARASALSGGLCSDAATPATQMDNMKFASANDGASSPAATATARRERRERRDGGGEEDEEEERLRKAAGENHAAARAAFRPRLAVDLAIFPHKSGENFALWAQIDERAAAVDGLLEACRKVLVANVQLERIWTRLNREKAASGGGASMCPETEAIEAACERSVAEYDELGIRLASELAALHRARAQLSAAAERIDGVVAELRATGEDSARLLALIEQKEVQANDARRLGGVLDDLLMTNADKLVSSPWTANSASA